MSRNMSDAMEVLNATLSEWRDDGRRLREGARAAQQFAEREFTHAKVGLLAEIRRRTLLRRVRPCAWLVAFGPYLATNNRAFDPYLATHNRILVKSAIAPDASPQFPPVVSASS
jgi:hypothetical protein